jgi:hypothetical protein
MFDYVWAGRGRSGVSRAYLEVHEHVNANLEQDACYISFHPKPAFRERPSDIGEGVWGGNNASTRSSLSFKGKV